MDNAAVEIEGELGASVDLFYCVLSNKPSHFYFGGNVTAAVRLGGIRVHPLVDDADNCVVTPFCPASASSTTLLPLVHPGVQNWHEWKIRVSAVS